MILRQVMCIYRDDLDGRGKAQEVRWRDPILPKLGPWQGGFWQMTSRLRWLVEESVDNYLIRLRWLVFLEVSCFLLQVGC